MGQFQLDPAVPSVGDLVVVGIDRLELAKSRGGDAARARLDGYAAEHRVGGEDLRLDTVDARGPARVVRVGEDQDAVRGRLDLVEGWAYTRDMRMKGTIGKVEISGSSNLVEQTYDQQVVITPNLSASLPLVGELAVPGSGITVLLLGTVLKGLGLEIERIGELTYTLSGSWSDPVMTQRKTTPIERRTSEK